MRPTPAPRVAAALALGLGLATLEDRAGQAQPPTAELPRAPSQTQETAAPQAAPAHSQWQISLGAGLGVAPSYTGADGVRLGAVPVLDITWRERLFLSTSRGLGAYIFTSDNFNLGASVAFSDSRDEKTNRRQLLGTGKVESSPELRLFGDYTLGPVDLSAQVSHAFGSFRPDKPKRDATGTLVTLGAAVGFPLTERLSLQPGVSVTWADQDYTRTFFGVTPSQARPGRRAFRPGSGVRDVSVTLGANYQISQHWTASVQAGASYLVGDAGRSPLTINRWQPEAAVVATYTF